MASLFVSHSSQDAVKTAELVDRLRGEGFQALFVDFDPECGIPAGHDWEHELYSQLRRADGVLYVASPASAASQWCFAELSLARAIGKPIFPVLVAGSERLTLLSDVQWVDLAADGEGAYGRLVAGLRRAGLDLTDAFAWDPTRPPYPGLEPFSPEPGAVSIEIGGVGESVTRAWVSEEALRGAVRGDLPLLLKASARDVILRSPFNLLMCARTPRLLFNFEKLCELFASEIIPTHVALSSESPTFFSPVRAEVIGPA